MRCASGVVVRLVTGHLQLLILLKVLFVLRVRSFCESSRIIRRSVLKVCRCEVRRRVGKRTCRNAVLMVAKAALSTYRAMVLMLVVAMLCLMTMVLVLKALVHVHLIVLVAGTAIEQTMILSVVGVVVHAAVRVVRR